MAKDKVNMTHIFIYLIMINGILEAGTTTLSGTAGSYTSTGTDNFGFNQIFVNVSNFLTDDGLNKIIGSLGVVGSIMSLWSGRVLAAIVVIVVSLVFIFLPQIADGLYGAVI